MYRNAFYNTITKDFYFGSFRYSTKEEALEDALVSLVDFGEVELIAIAEVFETREFNFNSIYKSFKQGG